MSISKIEQVSIYSLPNEIVVHIFHFIPSEYLENCMRVCIKWKDLVDNYLSSKYSKIKVLLHPAIHIASFIEGNKKRALSLMKIAMTFSKIFPRFYAKPYVLLAFQTTSSIENSREKISTWIKLCSKIRTRYPKLALDYLERAEKNSQQSKFTECLNEVWLETLKLHAVNQDFIKAQAIIKKINNNFTRFKARLCLAKSSDQTFNYKQLELASKIIEEYFKKEPLKSILLIKKCKCLAKFDQQAAIQFAAELIKSKTIQNIFCISPNFLELLMQIDPSGGEEYLGQIKNQFQSQQPELLKIGLIEAKYNKDNYHITIKNALQIKDVNFDELLSLCDELIQLNLLLGKDLVKALKEKINRFTPELRLHYLIYITKLESLFDPIRAQQTIQIVSDLMQQLPNYKPDDYIKLKFLEAKVEVSAMEIDVSEKKLQPLFSHYLKAFLIQSDSINTSRDGILRKKIDKLYAQSVKQVCEMIPTFTSEEIDRINLSPFYSRISTKLLKKLEKRD